MYIYRSYSPAAIGWRVLYADRERVGVTYITHKQVCSSAYALSSSTVTKHIFLVCLGTSIGSVRSIMSLKKSRELLGTASTEFSGKTLHTYHMCTERVFLPVNHIVIYDELCVCVVPIGCGGSGS